ncbi:tRNA (adenosine(37)-N6)-dimethylallyltransferase MiaA [Leucobacter chromiireducens]|uniref:tRNA dimethylallyltransferase n=1 Tax=Leucobacter chromiireducens subsp. chromiireducens TaxID=660067 RepID=A0ABS1SM94_9MICO|nr:tRNA (adenosine(37)-N6)-dimethylallyltransferase MiaA [Leucobacter chromiireducens]MBL3689265.1 tRNA (adenosine(37)-N6)-dimethylallyltransferase MiaA [Leucobacter chromiireducens subsp. chromiireducens]
MSEAGPTRATPAAVNIAPGARGPALWAVVGATGTGKSALSLDLAEALAERGRPAEVVNADAMQFYRGMDIGTAKLPVAERRGIPHHLFDVLAPATEATVAWYQPVARAVIDEIHARGADAILIGGSGLYVSSVIFDFQFPPRDENTRAALEAQLAEQGVAPLLARLAELSPETAASVDGQNPRRVVRALEVALLGGDARTTLPAEPALWYPDTRIAGVTVERAELVARLDARVTGMWADGLLEEVRELIPEGIEQGPTASRAIGYAQALAQLAGTMSEAEAIAETQALTRRYARRQVSWFKRYPGIEWRAPGVLPDLSAEPN